MHSKSNPVVWFEIYVQDMERAKSFYEAVLAIKLCEMPAPTAEMTMENVVFPHGQRNRDEHLRRRRHASKKWKANPLGLVAPWYILVVKTVLLKRHVPSHMAVF